MAHIRLLHDHVGALGPGVRCHSPRIGGQRFFSLASASVLSKVSERAFSHHSLLFCGVMLLLSRVELFVRFRVSGRRSSPVLSVSRLQKTSKAGFIEGIHPLPPTHQLTVSGSTYLVTLHILAIGQWFCFLSVRPCETTRRRGIWVLVTAKNEIVPQYVWSALIPRYMNVISLAVTSISGSEFFGYFGESISP